MSCVHVRLHISMHMYRYVHTQCADAQMFVCGQRVAMMQGASMYIYL